MTASGNTPAPASRPGLGRVYLVGAGPGSADLVTVRGARRLAEADLVLYDALASEEMRVYAPDARWFFVGKRACRESDHLGDPERVPEPPRDDLRSAKPTCGHAISQDVLNRLLVKYARRGLTVVRLKCGDPFVFGRGGEEALALVRAGVPFEIVPGVSTAVAAPALAGIPVTHRGLASSFLVVTGHHEETYAPILDGLPPGSATVVAMMGLRQRGAIAARLLARGWSAETPAAIVVGAATPESWRWVGPLGALGAAEIPAASASAPGMLVIGQVVGLATELASELAPAVSVETNRGEQGA